MMVLVGPLQLQLHHQVFPLECLQALQQVWGQVLHACMFRNALSKKQCKQMTKVK